MQPTSGHVYVCMLQLASANPDSLIPLMLFTGGTMAAITCYGGLFSVLPAYLADVFGQKHVGAIHGRALTAWSGAGTPFRPNKRKPAL